MGEAENLNPAGSIKEGHLIAMLRKAENENSIERGKTTLIEASSGNNGNRTCSLLSGKRV